MKLIELALSVGHAVPDYAPCLQAERSLQTRRVKTKPDSGYVYILTNKCLKGMVKPEECQARLID